MAYLWVTLGSAMGGLLRYAITRWAMTMWMGSTWGTVAINVAGSFLIGWFGTFTLQSGRYPASDNIRLFVMVGIYTVVNPSDTAFMRADAWRLRQDRPDLSIQHDWVPYDQISRNLKRAPVPPLPGRRKMGGQIN